MLNNNVSLQFVLIYMMDTYLTCFGNLHFGWSEVVSLLPTIISYPKWSTIIYFPPSVNNTYYSVWLMKMGHLKNSYLTHLLFSFPFQSSLDIYITDHYNLHLGTILEMLVIHIGIWMALVYCKISLQHTISFSSFAALLNSIKVTTV